MSPVVPPTSDPSPNEELVAYLDGELAPDESRAVEDRLANDPAYRQQLHELDQAWEALASLPVATVDDSFARTTIELACVAAEEDLSQQRVLDTLEDRSRTRWWVAAGAAALLMGFLMMRVFQSHRLHAELRDLPAIRQADALAVITDIDLLRKLAKAVPVEEFANEQAALNRETEEFAHINSAEYSDRASWIDSLTDLEKASWADRTRAYHESRLAQAERERQRKLTDAISDEPALQRTLVAFGQWLANHSPAEQDRIREVLRDQSVDQKIAEIQRRARQEHREKVWRLSPEDASKLREELLAFAEAKRADLLQGRPLLEPRRLTPNWGEEIMNQLVAKLSDQARAHWKSLHRREQRLQFGRWLREALQPKWGAAELEEFFASDRIPPDERQRLFDLPKAEMTSELESLFLRSCFGSGELQMLLREFGEGQRFPRFGANGDTPNRPGDGPPRLNPNGPPMGAPPGPEGHPRPGYRPQPSNRFDREPPHDPTRPPPHFDAPPPNGPFPPPQPRGNSEPI
ncbi:MAG: hypothetical protein IT425_04045 [Pirellulales bacterium]|nr:hypothetical protein [Pirellulales bacterium]